MSEEIQIILPKLGESILHATVIHWFKNEGDVIQLDEPLLEVSTDKINSEIPSPVAGILKKIVAQPNQEIAVGEILALVVASDRRAVFSPQSQADDLATAPQEPDFLSPSVLRLLKEKNISLSDVSKIPRTGQEDRLTKKDVEAYAASQHNIQPCSYEGDVERVRMTPLRKAIADNMVRSFYEAPHASLATEVDVTSLMQLIKTNKEAFAQSHGVKLSVTSFVARAMARSLKGFPLINASLEGDTIVMKKFVNMGIAVGVDQGVMVPVIRGIEFLSLPEIAKQISALAEKARQGKLSSSDMQDGSITLTNFGMTGIMLGVPIIRYPEVAIVGLGAVTQKVMPMPDGTMAIRSVLWISLTFDHRVLDGIYGCGFLSALKHHLEQDTDVD